VKGTNIITLCQAEMVVAIQHYLATVVMKAEVAAGIEVVKVVQMTKNNTYDSNHFEIEVQEKKAEVKP
jgi:hypothetical protein